MGKNLSWHNEDRNATIVLSILAAPLIFLDKDKPPFPVRGNGNRLTLCGLDHMQAADHGLTSSTDPLLIDYIII